MSGLTAERDWMRTCSRQPARPPEERAMWARLADEIDLYLTGDTEVVSEPTADDVALWEDA